MSATAIDFNGDGAVFDIDPGTIPQGIRTIALDCIARQKAATAASGRTFQPDPDALARVSEQALEETLSQGGDVHGIATDRSISNVIPFNAGKYEDAVMDAAVRDQREALDNQLGHLLTGLFNAKGKLYFTTSGHFWYPKGAFMSWHTNSKVPGWRAYLSYAEDPGESFFRYRECDSGRIVTLNDGGWNLRVFKLSTDRPLWHAVYSNTNRFSFGYLVTARTLAERIESRLRRRRALANPG